MNEFANQPEATRPAEAAFTDLARWKEDHNSYRRRLLFGKVELRAGWRFLIWLSLILAISLVLSSAVRLVQKAPEHRRKTTEVTVERELAPRSVAFLVVLLATFLMAKLEKRPVGAYGLPRRGAFGRLFWQGALWGFGALTLLLLTLRATHHFYFGSVALHGKTAAYYAVMWGLAFLAVAGFEEYFLRGYLQFTFTTGMGFWPAAFLTSLLFGAAHLGNPGENALGLFMVVVDGLFMCLILRRTGNLWFCIGNHAAWDWGQTFFYGTPDSGVVAPGHLFDSIFTGPKWITGGTDGPEGSFFIVPLYALLFIAFHYAYRKAAPYPDPAAIKEAAPPQEAAELATTGPVSI